MKIETTLKSFADLSPYLGIVHGASAEAIPETSRPPKHERVRDLLVQPDRGDQSFREKLHERATAPYVSAISYHRWGINE